MVLDEDRKFHLFITKSLFCWFPKKTNTKNKCRCEQKYIHFWIFQIIELLHINRIN